MSADTDAVREIVREELERIAQNNPERIAELAQAADNDKRSSLLERITRRGVLKTAGAAAVGAGLGTQTGSAAGEDFSNAAGTLGSDNQPLSEVNAAAGQFQSVSTDEIYHVSTISEVETLVQSDEKDYVRLELDRSYQSSDTLTIDAQQWSTVDRNIHIWIPFFNYTGSGRAIEIINNDGTADFQGRVTLHLGDLIGDFNNSGTRGVVVEDFTGATVDYQSIRGFEYGVYGNIVDTQVEQLSVIGKKIRQCDYNIRLEGSGDSQVNDSMVGLTIDTTLATDNTALFLSDIFIQDHFIRGASFTSDGQTGWFVDLDQSGFGVGNISWRFDGPGGTDIDLQNVGRPPTTAQFNHKATHTAYNDPNDEILPRKATTPSGTVIKDRGREIRRETSGQTTKAVLSSDQSITADGSLTEVDLADTVTEMDTYGQLNADNNAVVNEFPGRYKIHGKVRVSGISDGDTVELELRRNGVRDEFVSKSANNFGTVEIQSEQYMAADGNSITLAVGVFGSTSTATIRSPESETSLTVKQA